MNQRLSHSFAGRYLAFAFLGYLIVGSSGLNENAIMVTNALSYWFVVDPYLFIWILGLPISAVLSGRTGAVHFDHMSQTMMRPLSVAVVCLGIVGIIAVIATMKGIRLGKSGLRALIAFLSIAALLNIAIMLTRFFSPATLDSLPSLYNDSMMNGIPSAIWISSYWYAYSKTNAESPLKPEVNSGRS
jgi:hypothetical protein